jgi:hypothetical protein
MFTCTNDVFHSSFLQLKIFKNKNVRPDVEYVLYLYFVQMTFPIKIMKYKILSFHMGYIWHFYFIFSPVKISLY